MRNPFFARHSETGVIYIASAETDAHPKMRPCSLEEAEEAGIDVTRYREKAQRQAAAPGKNKGGRPKKAAPVELRPGQIAITDEKTPVTAVDGDPKDGADE